MSSSSSFSAVVQPRRARLSDTIAEQIEGLIASGELKPGDNLPPERDLSKQLDVSRPSLREALLVLESRGLLQARRGGGYCVTDVTAPVITDPLVHLLQRHPSTVDDVLELRHGIECIAAQFAALRATDTDIKKLNGLVTRMRKRKGEFDAFEDAERDVDFHMAVAVAGSLIPHKSGVVKRRRRVGAGGAVNGTRAARVGPRCAGGRGSIRTTDRRTAARPA